MRIDGLSFDPPVGFATEEQIVALKLEPAAELRDPRALHKQTVARPSLIIHAKKPPEGATIERLFGDMVAELAHTVSSMDDLSTGTFMFKDGSSGMVAAFNFKATSNLQLRQFHVLRLDPERVTAATLTLGAEASEAAQNEYLRAVASLVPAAG
jgi:hypothetical protein